MKLNQKRKGDVTMEEFLKKFVELIEGFITVIKELVSGIRKYNDEN